ncbi:MAG: M48 family metallopeptidase [Verrucomicrobiota bacterium]|nr:M48 family metallopeptidase [Verrucomicrobiota bacterium]
MNKHAITICALLLALATGGLALALIQKNAASGPQQHSVPRPKIPKAISSENFQRQADRDLIERLRKIEAAEITTKLDAVLVKPFVDDVNTRSLCVEGLEVSENQFPILHSIVLDCARILRVSPVPRVFVSERPELSIAIENFSEPVIVIHSSLLWRFQDGREQRFLIGREFGHIIAGHVRWQTLSRSAQLCVNQTGFGAGPLKLLVLPLLQWTREAEMSADNAGLICAQDIKIAERTLVSLATGVHDFALHEIHVDEYLKQAGAQSLSGFSEVALFWKELHKPTPFAPERIRQLREFEASDRYRRLWN